jgi:hypothetical protein
MEELKCELTRGAGCVRGDVSAACDGESEEHWERTGTVRGDPGDAEGMWKFIVYS